MLSRESHAHVALAALAPRARRAWSETHHGALQEAVCAPLAAWAAYTAGWFVALCFAVCDAVLWDFFHLSLHGLGKQDETQTGGAGTAVQGS